MAIWRGKLEVMNESLRKCKPFTCTFADCKILDTGDHGGEGAFVRGLRRAPPPSGDLYRSV